MNEGRTGCFRLKLGPDGIAILVRLHVRAKDFMLLGKTKSKILQSLGKVNESITCNVRNTIEFNKGFLAQMSEIKRQSKLQNCS